MRGAGLVTAARFALRELRGGLSGFGVFIACIVIGVAAIAGVNSVSRALVGGLVSEGGAILGGDVSASLIHRQAGAGERAELAALGRLSVAATLRGMARAQGAQTLVEIKAVDDAYPLYGALALRDAAPPPGLGIKDGHFGAYVEPGLLERLGTDIGSTVAVGDAVLEIRGVIDSEPDRLAGGIGFGPRLMVSLDGLEATGLVQPGSLVRWRYRVALPAGSGDGDVEAAMVRLERDLGREGFRIEARTDAAPGLRSRIERFTQFLTLVGLTALIVGGVGIANAVRAHLDGRRGTIATLKALGGTGGFVTAVYLIQIGIIAAGATLLGAALGAFAPMGAQALARMLLPVSVAAHGVFPGELALAALFSMITTFAFAIWPLGRVRLVPVSAIFRDSVETRPCPVPPSFVAAAAIAALALAAMVLLLSADKRVALIFMGAMAASLVLLWGVGYGVKWLARNAGRPRSAVRRLALANIHRPGALTGSIVLSLGLGLTLLVALSLIDTGLRRQLMTTIPDKAPSFFFVDVPRQEAEGLRGLISTAAPASRVEEVPMLRGQLLELGGVSTDRIEASPDTEWALRGDRGITYSATLPENSTLVEGEWWPADYSGEPLVSFEADLARAFGVGIGDMVKVNVLGREIEARIANTRSVDWASLGINFVMVFSPNTFAGAPHMMLATVTLPDADAAAESAIAAAVARAYPSITSIRIKEALDAVNSLVEKLAWAVRAASGVALVAAMLVLAGALAASHRHRIADAVILKMLGASRRQLLAAYFLEFAGIGAVTAAFALAAGGATAWVVLTQVMDVAFQPSWGTAAAAVAAALAAMVAAGLLGTGRALAGRPAEVLRNL
ncbi:MAG: ABC transporter permease [Flavobacteriaceae bacterium]